jgi:hypothetical protein
VIALYRAISLVCLHDVSMIVIGVEGADQGEEEPSHHHVGCPYPVNRHNNGRYTEIGLQIR